MEEYEKIYIIKNRKAKLLMKWMSEKRDKLHEEINALSSPYEQNKLDKLDIAGVITKKELQATLNAYYEISSKMEELFGDVQE